MTPVFPYNLNMLEDRSEERRVEESTLNSCFHEYMEKLRTDSSKERSTPTNS